MQKILLAGATGNLGPFLAKAFIEKGYELYALIRPETLSNPDKINPLKALGVHIIEGDLNHPQSIEKACKGMDVIVSALGAGQIMQQEVLLNAAKLNNVKRFIPSEFGVNPYASDRGICDLFDAKFAMQQKVKASGVPYTMIYTNGFQEFWASGLGQLGNTPTSGKVDVFGEGDVPASMVALPDIGRFTAEIIQDDKMNNQEVSITANTLTQEELIRCWEDMSESKVERNPISEKELIATIEKAKIPEEIMQRTFGQLHHSVWIKGDTAKNFPNVIEATKVYPQIPVRPVETFFKGMMEMA